MGYWIPSDAELDDPSSFIFNSQMKDYAANIPARHIFMVVDSVFSGSLMGRTRGIGKAGSKVLYQRQSRWVMVSDGLYPVPDASDRIKNGHSQFALDFMKKLRVNSAPYLPVGDFVVPSSVPCLLRAPRCLDLNLRRHIGPVTGAGDEGGQFVFRLQKEFQKPVPDAGEPPIVEATLRPFQTPKAKDLAPTVTIPAGEFVMGSKPGEGQSDENPQRKV